MYNVRERDWPRDEFGPEHVFEVFDPSNSEIIGWVVVDNTWRSPDGVGKGGTAMYPSCDLRITARKGRTMTWKQVFCSPIGEMTKYKPWGGGKGGIQYDSSKPDAEMRLRKWARALHDAQVIPQKYIFGLDVGLKEWATKAVVEELGRRDVSTGKPENLGGIPYDELGITGLGLLDALRVMCEYKGVDFDNPKTTIAIQGFGAVGQGFMKWLAKLSSHARPEVVAISDIGGAVVSDYMGFSPEESIKTIRERESIIFYPGTRLIHHGAELFIDVDILLLAYKEDQITMDNQHNVKAKIILQGANMGITRDAEKTLHARNILSLPDFVVNSGASSIVYVEYNGGSIEDGVQYVQKVLPHNARIILDEMKRSRVTPRELALDIAESEVRKAQPPRDIERAILT